MDLFNTYIKPHLCSIIITGVGVYFVSPMVVPRLSSVPIINNLGRPAQEALLAGLYAGSAMTVCDKTGLVSMLG
jgi:hypothetical protein